MSEMFNDKTGYNVKPETAICLTKNFNKKEEGGRNKSETTSERMFALNVRKKDKSEYEKIWKLLKNEYKIGKKNRK